MARRFLSEPLAPWSAAAALALQPLWVSALPEPLPSVNGGRLLVAAMAVSLVLDAVRRVAPRRRPTPWLLGFAAAAVGLGAWIAISAATEGCFCRGSAYGYGDLVAGALLAGVVALLHPDRARLLVAGLLVGALLAAGLALGGVHDVGGSTPAATRSTRLTGPYFNANYLALAVAMLVPLGVAVAGRPRRRAVFAAGVLAVGVAVLALSLSRGGILAAALGGVAALGLLAGGRRGLVRSALALLLLAGAGALAYPLYQRERTEADFGPPKIAIDAQGWNVRAAGRVSRDGATARSARAGGLIFAASRAGSEGRGASRYLGRIPAGAVSLRMRLSPVTGRRGGPTSVVVGLNDLYVNVAPAFREVRVARADQGVRLRWRPPRAAPSGRLYLLLPRGGGVRVEGVRLTVDPAGPTPAVSGVLAPVVARGQTAESEAKERRYVRSRVDGARLALDVFGEEPLRGVGWERFPEVSRRRLAYGAFPTHNEYLRVAAELGVPGILLLAALLAVVALAVPRVPDRRVRAALGGVAATGAVGLVFVNALGLPTTTLAPMAAGAIACALAARRAPLPPTPPPELEDEQAPDLGRGVVPAR